MEDILFAVGRVTKVEDDAGKIKSTLKVVAQTSAASDVKNLDMNLKAFIVKGQLEFGKTYEVIIRQGLQKELPMRMIREDDDEPQTTSPFRRPAPKRDARYEWEPNNEDEDEEDIDI